jgi:hypothetical protein
MNRTIRILSLIALLNSCGSGFKGSEQKKLKERNSVTEWIQRSSGDQRYVVQNPEHTPRSPYPWETQAHLPRITREFFRCRGSSLNPSLVAEDGITAVLDCDGRHGLPVFAGREGIYPVLVELLNFLQKRTGRRVIITSGHRCPAHNGYVDPSKEAKTSKHQIGAEVDFYIQGMEDQPLEIVALIMQYYQENPVYKNQKECSHFVRYDKPDARVATAPWYNKEIFIKLNEKNENRDKDNLHPYPYLTIQVRFDRDKKERVVFDWERAHKGYPRG